MAAKPKSKPKAKPGPVTTERINARAAKDRQFLKRALKNPGLRSKLDPKYLAAPQRQARELNTRLNSPITPGSAVTGRDLAHEAEAATTVRYGPQERQLGQQLGVAQQTERDTGSFYDEYRRNLEAHTQAIAAYQAGAQQALAQTAAGITGLAGTEGAAMQQQANAGAAQQGVAPAGNLMPDANAAAATRQALIGSFQAQQALTGAANNQYASAQSNVVAPGQKLSALAQARGRTQGIRKDQEALAQQEGAFNQQFRSERRQDEFKNVLAQQTLAGNQANQQADNAIAAANAASNAAARSPEGKAAATTATENAKNAAKLGITPHQYALLGPTERQRRLKALKGTTRGSASDTRYTSGPFAGMLKSDVNKLSDSEARAKVDAYAKRGGKKPGEKGAGPDWKPTQAMSKGMSQVNSLKSYAAKAKRGEAFVPGHARQGPLDRHAAARKIQESVAAPDDPVLLTAALDAAYDGHLSAATVRKLIAAGYKPARVASTLGVPTAANYKPPRPRRQPRRTGPGRNVTIPGLSGPGVSPNR